jgi:hypothetical protein
MVGLTQQMLAEWRAGHHLDIAHAM